MKNTGISRNLLKYLGTFPKHILVEDTGTYSVTINTEETRAKRKKRRKPLQLTKLKTSTYAGGDIIHSISFTKEKLKEIINHMEDTDTLQVSRKAFISLKELE